MALSSALTCFRVLGRCNLNPLIVQTRHLNANRTSITKISRKVYAKTYPTVLVQEDGSTYHLKYKEPRQIIKLPFDMSSLSEAEKVKRIERRRPKKIIVIEDEIEDTFDASSYDHLWKK